MIDPNWVLFDDFLTDRAAGAVNGTAAEPVGGNRNVVDTESKMSIAGGKLTVAGGKTVPAWGNPGIWYPSVARTPGKVLIAHVNRNLGLGPMIGFNTAASGGVMNSNSFYFAVSSVYHYASGAIVLLASAIGANTDYSVAIAVRSSGCFCFIKGGTFTAWTLLWIDSLRSDPTLYPGVTNFDSPYTNDLIRHADTLWLPVPNVSDGFSATDSDGGGHQEVSGVGSGGAGVVWTGSTWSNVGGRAKNTPALIGAELCINGNMETGDPPSTWQNINTGVSDGVADERTGGSGIQSISIANGIASAGGVAQPLGLSAGKWIQATVWARRVTNNPRMIIATTGYVTLSTVNTANTTWTQLIATARMTDAGRIWLLGVGGSIGLECRLDDCSVRELALVDLFRSVTVSTPDVMASVELNPYVTGTQAGLALNLDSTSNPQNLVLCVLDGANIKVEKCVAGVWTTLSTTAFTYVAGKKLVAWKLGTKYRFYYGDTLIGSELTISDAGIINNTRHGKFSTDAVNEFDNFLVYAVTSTDYDNALNVTYTKNPTGTFSFSGLIRRLLNRRVAGGFSFSGILTTSNIGSAIKRVVSLTGRWLTTVSLRGKK